jgi:hypothetical protein
LGGTVRLESDGEVKLYMIISRLLACLWSRMYGYSVLGTTRITARTASEMGDMQHQTSSWRSHPLKAKKCSGKSSAMSHCLCLIILVRCKKLFNKNPCCKEPNSKTPYLSPSLLEPFEQLIASALPGVLDTSSCSFLSTSLRPTIGPRRES